ncbi:MAG: hypothetical protein CMI30_01475 [Opitutae bacterium]|nr:hypothetical protein [Opitutae bacterium]|tara:strand:+ start:6835 stop:7524 length:690 start_codon:yes stop_codon:yes gene_type:complete
MIMANDRSLLATAYRHVLEASSEEWSRRLGKGFGLQASQTELGEIRIMPGGLCFSDEATFLEAVTTGFAWPRIGPFLSSPVQSLRAVGVLRGMTSAVQGGCGPEVKAAVGLRAGLAAAEAYAALDLKCVEAMARESSGCVSFTVANTDVSAWFRMDAGGYRSGSGEPSEDADARVTFRDLEVAVRAVETGLDPLVAPANGEIEVRGRIPLAEAVGYVADRASRNLVFPT